MSIELPVPIATDLPDLLASLRELRFKVISHAYNDQAFGNYFVEVTDGVFNLRIVRDRGQYYVDGPEHELRAAGLWQAFDGKTHFETHLLAWLYRREVS